MARLSEQNNPFKRRTLYEILDIPPYADNEAVSARLEQLMNEMEALPEEKRSRHLPALQEALKTVKSTRLRVLVNALLLDRLNHRRAVEILRHTGKLDEDQLKLPELDFSQVLVEGESLEIASQDFKDVPTLDELELDLKAINEILLSEPPERVYSWDL